MIGPPGTGKTLLAKRLPTILPPLTPAESLETARIYSAMDRLEPGQPNGGKHRKPWKANALSHPDLMQCLSVMLGSGAARLVKCAPTEHGPMGSPRAEDGEMAKQQLHAFVSFAGPSVFISYASEDVDAALKLYIDLKAAGARPWIDRKDLKAGQRWPRAIEEAISHSRYFIALLSSRSIDKRGYVQKEVRKAIDALKEFPDHDIFIIQVRLDDCKPENLELRDLHRVDLFPDWNSGLEQILRSMKLDTDDGHGVLEILKRIYLESGGDEDRMIEAIKGLKGQIDATSYKVTNKGWVYLLNMCPPSIMNKLKSVLQEPSSDTSNKEDPDPLATAVADDAFPAVGTREWGLMNQRRAALIRKKNRQGLTADENGEFERLQHLCFSALEQSTPGPIIDEDGLRRLRESL